MDPIDLTQEQRVWSRVMAAPTACQTIQPPNYPVPLNAEVKTTQDTSAYILPRNQTPAAGSRQAAGNGIAPNVFILDEQALMELYTAQLRAALTYCTLAKQLCGCTRQAVLRLAEAKRCHGRRLAALYYIRTGQKPCPDRPKAPCIACPNEALRQAYQEELCSAELYRAYAKNAGDLACILEQLAQEACQHAQLLLQVLQETL